MVLILCSYVYTVTDIRKSERHLDTKVINFEKIRYPEDNLNSHNGHIYSNRQSYNNILYMTYILITSNPEALDEGLEE